MKRYLVLATIFLLCGIASAQTVKQTMVNSPGGVQSAGDAYMPVPYDTCPKGYRCKVIQIGTYTAQGIKWEPVYCVHADGTKTVQYMIVGTETKPKKAHQPHRRYAHLQQQSKPAETKPDQQAEFKAAQKRVVDAQTALLPYQQEFESAVASRNAVIWKMMAEAGTKPSECVAPDKDGRPNPFACLKQDPATGVISFEKLVTSKTDSNKPKSN